MTASDWHSDKSQVMCNTRMPKSEQQAIAIMLDTLVDLPGHVWIATSGSTSVKWVALSKNAILASAKAVNAHLKSNEKDIWINPLPDFHVGGLGIIVRGYVSGAKVIDASIDKWNANAFYNLTCDFQATLTALVPTQVFDLVAAKLHAPRSLRAVIVGGGGLGVDLYRQAKALGWPLLPSYGLTECASQVATASLDSLLSDEFPLLQVLPHFYARINSDGLINVKGESLLSGYAVQNNGKAMFIDPKHDGWFQSEDMGSLENGFLTVHGRQGDFVKIGGEGVDIGRLQHILNGVKLDLNFVHDIALVAIPDQRLGHVVNLAATCSDNIVQPIVTAFNAKVLPFERIRKTHCVDVIPRTALNKLCKSELLQMLQ